MLDRRCNAGKISMSACKRRLEAVAEDVDDEGEEREPLGRAGSELMSRDLSFKPLFLISNWTERTYLSKRLSISKILPSRIGSGRFTITVVDDGNVSQISV